jgi:hypothetical protein
MDPAIPALIAAYGIFLVGFLWIFHLNKSRQRLERQKLERLAQQREHPNQDFRWPAKWSPPTSKTKGDENAEA